MIGSIQLEGDGGQRLATADGHISTAQSQQVLLELLQLGFTRADAFAHCPELIIRAFDFRIAVTHILAESSALRFESACLFLQWFQCAAQLPGSSLGISQDLSCFDRIGTSLLELLTSLALGFAAFFQIRAAAAQACLKVIEFEQANAELPAHQQHHAKRKSTDQAPRQHRDHHGRLAWAKPEEAEPGLADS